MMKTIGILFIAFIFVGISAAQPKPHPQSTPKVVPVKAGVDLGTISGRTYTNKAFGFELTVPDSWLLPDHDFEDYMKKQGFDLSLKAPDSISPAEQANINKALRRVTVLATAYRSMPGSDENAILRISVEDLSANPQIKDAVDYFDAIRANYKTMKLPPDFTYSETQAEKLGPMQFGYIDTSNIGGKKRMYATVRKGYAIMFTLSYGRDEDLLTMKHMLADANFSLK